MACIPPVIVATEVVYPANCTFTRVCIKYKHKQHLVFLECYQPMVISDKYIFNTIEAHIVTVRNEVANVMFLHLSVIMFTGGYLPQYMLGYTHAGAHIPSPRSRHTPLAADPQEQTPSSRQLLLRTVRILQECILVFLMFADLQIYVGQKNNLSVRTVEYWMCEHSSCQNTMVTLNSRQ